ncbi:MAG: IS5 family transposase [Pseudomonadota bacterium]
MPNKHNDPRRHHIPRARYKVENWPEYDRGLVQRGDIRFWISDEALAGWIAPSRATPGGQQKFSNLAIEATLVLGTVFKLPLRQTEGFVRSLMALLKRDLPVPDHTTLARRRRTVKVDQHAPGRTGPVDLVLDSTGLKFFGPGEWTRQKHGEKRRSWRKLHIGIDAGTGEILAHALTADDISDPAMAGDLVAKAGGRIRTVIADGAYDGQPTYDQIRAARLRKSPPRIVIPPRTPSILDRGSSCGGSERERHALRIGEIGRLPWPDETGYGRRSIVETGVFRLKQITGGRLTARTFGAQKAEAKIAVAVANKAIRAAKPILVRAS